MAKKKNTRYQIKDRDWKAITKGLLKKKSDGTLPVDSIMQTADKCPFCGTSAWVDDKGGKISPVIVDKTTLSFRTLCCSVRGGACNYLMITRKCDAEEAIKILKEAIR